MLLSGGAVRLLWKLCPGNDTVTFQASEVGTGSFALSFGIGTTMEENSVSGDSFSTAYVGWLDGDGSGRVESYAMRSKEAAGVTATGEPLSGVAVERDAANGALTMRFNRPVSGAERALTGAATAALDTTSLSVFVSGAKAAPFTWALFDSWAPASGGALSEADQHSDQSRSYVSVNLLTGAAVATDEPRPLWLTALLAFAFTFVAGLACRVACVRSIVAERVAKFTPLALLPDAARRHMAVWFVGYGPPELGLLAAWAAAAAVLFRAAVASSPGDLFHATAFGKLLAPCFGAALLPVTRNSPWNWALGSSFERSVALHRAWATAAVVLCAIHMGTMLYKHRPHNRLAAGGADFEWNLHDPHTHRSWMLNTNHFAGGVGRGVVYGTAAGGCLALLFVFSTPPVRRRAWRLFKLAHLVMGVPFLVLAGLHAHSMFTFTLPAITLYGLDKLVFAWRARRAFSATATELPGGAVRLEVATHVHMRPGQYMYVHCAAVSPFEWHPFSIVSSGGGKGGEADACLDGVSTEWDDGAEDGLEAALLAAGGGQRTVFLLKGASGNPRSFASRLLAANQAALRVRLDGPYGALSLSLERYDCVVLVAGGVGITPMVSVASELQRLHAQCAGAPLRAAWLCWSMREHGAAGAWLPSFMGGLSGSELFQGRAEVRLTGASRLESFSSFSPAARSEQEEEKPPPSPVAHADGFTTRGGRMDISAAVREAVHFGGRLNRVAVLACGPPSLLVAAQGAAAAFGASFHSGACASHAAGRCAHSCSIQKRLRSDADGRRT